MVITGDGSTSNENIAIDSSGRIYMSQLTGSTGGSDARYDTTTKELFYDTSALKYKTNIRDIKNEDIEFIKNIHVVKYDRKDGKRKDEIGILANDLVKTAPDYVCYDSSGDVDPYSGELLYIDNRSAVTRASDQTEDLKIVIQV